MPGNPARPVRRGAVRKRTRNQRAPRRTAYPTVRPARFSGCLCVWLGLSGDCGMVTRPSRDSVAVLGIFALAE